PNYFHKPSLHFYLRMPVVAASFLWGVREGHLRSIKEIRTRDKFGLAGYAITSSHPGIVMWNRAFSVLLSLGVLLFTFLITYEISGSSLLASIATLLAAFSPDAIGESAVIGVDVVMAFFVVASVYA